MNKKNTGILLFVFMVFVLLSCRSKVDEENIVARVGKTTLTKDELKNKMASSGIHPDQENDYIEKWVNRELLFLEAKQQGLDKSTEIRDELNSLEKEILIHKLLEKVFAEQIRLLDEEIASYYEKNKDLFTIKEEEAHVFHILTKTQYDANQAQQEIRAGKSFEGVAKERSTDTFRGKGGDMGFIKKTDVIPQIARFAFSLNEGSVSPIFQSTYGFHILKVVRKYKQADIKDLRDAREDILQRMRINKERSVYMDLLYQLQNKYKVYVMSSEKQSQKATPSSQ